MYMSKEIRTLWRWPKQSWISVHKLHYARIKTWNKTKKKHKLLICFPVVQIIFSELLANISSSLILAVSNVFQETKFTQSFSYS